MHGLIINPDVFVKETSTGSLLVTCKSLVWGTIYVLENNKVAFLYEKRNLFHNWFLYSYLPPPKFQYWYVCWDRTWLVARTIQRTQVIREQTVLVQKARGEEVRLQNNLEKKYRRTPFFMANSTPRARRSCPGQQKTCESIRAQTLWPLLLSLFQMKIRPLLIWQGRGRGWLLRNVTISTDL
jgi:hypothetical protein